ncbi:unnamed protein product [Arabidopsis lyrata]|nr:unnamed protein product [Arabidopsis lyrata]
MSSGSFSSLRSPSAPPSEPPSPPTPPEPPDPPDLQICLSSGDALVQLLLLQHPTGLQRSHIGSERPSPLPSRTAPPCRKNAPLSITVLARRRHLLLSPHFSNMNLGFHYLGQIWDNFLLGHGCLLGQKSGVFLLGLTFPRLSPPFSFYRVFSCLVSLLCCKPSQSHNLVVAINLPPQKFPQVCSYSSPSNSSQIGRVWMLVEFVALVLWNFDIAHSSSMSLDTFVSTFVLSCSTFIVLMRSFTAVCGFWLDLAMLKVVSSQLGQSSLSLENRPGFLVHWGYHSPHLSFMEFIIFPTTSLVFSDSVTGSIECKTVLLEVEARNLLVFGNRAFSEEDTALKAITAAKEWQEANLAVHGQSRNRAQAVPLIEDIPTPLPHSEDPSLILPLIEALSLNLPLIEAPFHRIPRDEVFSCYTDAAWIASSGSCGMGWIFKTQDHRVIHQGSATRLHTPSALAAEALALRSALIAASRMEFTSIKVFSDSQVLISLLNTETSTNELPRDSP